MPARKCFIALQKTEKLVMMVKSRRWHLTWETFWDKFDKKDLCDYHDHYFKKDALLLAEIFEKFIDTYLKFYGLDRCHYFSSPGLSWDAILKKTGVNWEKITDIDNYLFIEKGLGGGISYISKRYVKTNYKYMNDYDSKKLTKSITYLDMNNLYGWGLSGYLP